MRGDGEKVTWKTEAREKRVVKGVGNREAREKRVVKGKMGRRDDRREGRRRGNHSCNSIHQGRVV